MKRTALAFLLLVLAFPRAGAQAPAFEERSFSGEGGVEIHYLYRPGRGPAIVVLHGTILAAEALKQGAQEFFPGRPVLALYRRGYSPSARVVSTPEDIGRDNAADAARAVEEARWLSGGEKACLLAFSLGAMMLPPVDKEQILWAALVNPAAEGMLADLAPDQQALAWSLRNTYEASRYWYPDYRRAWIKSASQALVDDLIDRIRAQQTESGKDFADFLIERIHNRMERRVWQELIVQERLWALFSSWGTNLPEGVPVFLASSRDDGMIPPSTHERLARRLKASAAWVEEIRWPGGHLTPVFEPDLLIGRLSRFDEKAREATDSRSTP